jgi:hypothetical protein
VVVAIDFAPAEPSAHGTAGLSQLSALDVRGPAGRSIRRFVPLCGRRAWDTEICGRRSETHIDGALLTDQQRFVRYKKIVKRGVVNRGVVTASSR